MKIILLTLLTFASLLANARNTTGDWTKGFVEVRKGHSLYTEYRLPKNGKPTLYLLNGLTYSTKNWTDFQQALSSIDPDMGIVLYDMVGMGQTLLANAPALYRIPFANQLEDLHQLKQKLAISGPSAVLGLSYGGALALNIAAAYPDDFDQFIAMSPFLERLPDQDVIIKNEITLHHMWFPFDPTSDDDLYDGYLRIMIYNTYPAAEPSILDNPFKLEAVFRMVQGAKNWSAVGKISTLPLNKVHIVAARNDEYVKFDRMQIFLGALPPGQTASVAVFNDTHHKIPEERPLLAAQWIYQILRHNPKIQPGMTFNVYPSEREAKSGTVVIPLNQVSVCEALL